MASEVSICSNALRKLGDEAITSLTDNSDRARLCNNLYPEARDELLYVRNWNFAVKRESLSRLADAPPFGWSYQYQLPANCLRVIKLETNDFEFGVEGKVILTNAESVNLIYLSRETDPNNYSALFLTALEARLASDLAYPITGSSQIQAVWVQLADKRLAEAGAMDAAEGSPSIFIADDFTSIR